MALKIRMSRAGAKKRPFYRIVVADTRMPRDGRFIEKIGTFNPLLPKDNETRLKLDVERAKHWLAQGAKPSDRVARFLDAAGLWTRTPKHNPKKALPGAKAQERLEAQKQAEADAKAAEEEAAKAEAEEATKAEAETSEAETSEAEASEAAPAEEAKAEEAPPPAEEKAEEAAPPAEEKAEETEKAEEKAEAESATDDDAEKA